MEENLRYLGRQGKKGRLSEVLHEIASMSLEDKAPRNASGAGCWETSKILSLDLTLNLSHVFTAGCFQDLVGQGRYF